MAFICSWESCRVLSGFVASDIVPPFILNVAYLVLSTFKAYKYLYNTANILLLCPKE